jgi:hypothetical protein
VPTLAEGGKTVEMDTGTIENWLLAVALPFGLVTLSGPLVAPFGMAATMLVPLEYMMVAATPLNETVSWLDIVLNPVPLIVTVAPTAPDATLTEVTENGSLP